MKIETMTAWNEEDLKERINKIGKENFVKFENSWNCDYYTIWYWKEDDTCVCGYGCGGNDCL